MYEIGMDNYSHVKTVKTAVPYLYQALITSSYGLIRFHDYHNRNLMVFNPYTEQIRNLPDYPEQLSCYFDYSPVGPRICYRRYFNALGFGFDVKSKRYKVVQLVRDPKTHGISKCHVLTLERFESCWREISNASLDGKFEELSNTVCVDGVIYWESKYAHKKYHILAFNLGCEKINMILAPEECRDDMYYRFHDRHMVELQGNLCFVDAMCTNEKLAHMDIWRLNYSNEGRIGWASLCKLKFRWMPTRLPMVPMCMNGSRIILRGDGVIMYCYDVEEKCLKTYKGDGEDLYSALILVHTGTILPLD